MTWECLLENIETWYEVHITNLKNLFCHHYTAGLAIFSTKFLGFQQLFRRVLCNQNL